MNHIPFLKANIIILLFLSFTFSGISQVTYDKVTLIGENEKEYENMLSQCSTPLLYITNNSMDKAYKLWTKMLSTMQDKAEDQGLDIRGVKVWMNLFWESDGTIKNIAYYPKPNSKNMDFDRLTSFLQTFAEDYQLEVTNEACFSHYGSASFPVFTKIAAPNEK